MPDEMTTARVWIGEIEVGLRSLPSTLDVGDVLPLDLSDVRYRVDEVRSGDTEPQVRVVPAWNARVEASERTIHRIPSTDGVDVHVHDLGGSGSPVLICHATGFHGMAYAPFAAALGAHHRVFAADLRGHGSTDVPATGDFAWSGMADDVAAVLDALFDEPPVAVGHSMGGASILMAELRAPGSFRAAWLFEPIVFPGSWEPSPRENFMAKAAASRRAEFPSRESAFERYGARPPLDSLRPDALAAYVQHGFVDGPDPESPVRLACEPASESATFSTPGKLGLDEVGPLRLPIRVAGGHPVEGGGPQMMAEALAATASTASYAAYPHVGHFGPLEAPDEMAAEAAAFFAEHPANTEG